MSRNSSSAVTGGSSTTLGDPSPIPASSAIQPLLRISSRTLASAETATTSGVNRRPRSPRPRSGARARPAPPPPRWCWRACGRGTPQSAPPPCEAPGAGVRGVRTLLPRLRPFRRPARGASRQRRPDGQQDLEHAPVVPRLPLQGDVPRATPLVLPFASLECRSSQLVLDVVGLSVCRPTLFVH